MEIGRNPLNAGALTTAAIRGWFSKFTEVFVVSVVFTVPIFILNGTVVAGLVSDADGSIDFQGTVVASLVSVLLSGVLTAALTYVFVKVFREEPFTVGGAFEFIAAKIGPIFVFTFVTAILIVLGLIAIIIPGIALIIVFSLGMPALIDEDLAGLEAVRRSFQVISGNWGIALAVVLLGLLINVVLSVVLGGLSLPGSGTFSPPDFTDFNLTQALIQIIASALVAPLIPALATGLYYEAKGRDEGFPSIHQDPGFGDGNLFR